jgi:hypothetical protein
MAQADATTTAPHPDTQPTATLETGEDGTFVTGQIGISTNLPRTNAQLVLKLRAPFDPNGSKKDVGFLNLDGLTGGTTAALAFTLQGQLPIVFGSESTLTALCQEANVEVRKKFLADDPDISSVQSCTDDQIINDALLHNEVAKKKAEALFALCQDVNKKKGVGLLAPPGVTNFESFPGYTATCSEDELGKARSQAVEQGLRDKAKAKVIEDVIAQTPPSQPVKIPEGQDLEKAIDVALPPLVRDACTEFNKNRSRNRLFDPARKPDPAPSPLWFGPCTIENLGKAAVRDDLEAKQQEAMKAACQKRLAIASGTPFITSTTPLNNCFLTTLLDFAATSTKPNYWQRRALRAIPITLWYVTLEGTRVDQTFKFLDMNDTFKSKSVGSDSTSLNLKASIFTRGWLFTLGGNHQKRLTASPTSQVCLPISGTSALSCNQAALAGPKETTSNLVRAEVKTLAGSLGGVTLRSIYDTNQHDWEHHLIVHFLRNPKQGLNGGLDLQYNTDPVAAGVSTHKDDHFTARLFAGIKFGLPFLTGNPPTSPP